VSHADELPAVRGRCRSRRGSAD